MAQSTVELKGVDGLALVTALASASGGLQLAIAALAQHHGGKKGPWLDELEARMIKETKNIVFNGASMDAEAAAVRCALANLTNVFATARKRLT